MIIVCGINGIGIGVRDGKVRKMQGVCVENGRNRMKVKMTDDWREKIKENYELGGEHYYQFIRKCKQSKGKQGRQSVIIFDSILEELEQIRKERIIDQKK